MHAQADLNVYGLFCTGTNGKEPTGKPEDGKSK